MSSKPSVHKNIRTLTADRFPDLVTTCPKCGNEIELWPDTADTICFVCNYKLFEWDTTTH